MTNTTATELLSPATVRARILDAIRAKDAIRAEHPEVAAMYENRIDQALRALDRGALLAAAAEADDVATRAEAFAAA